jgi:hypothetical protein
MYDRLLNTTEAASLLGVSKAFLERDRWAGARIPFIRVGTRAVRYRPADLLAYLGAPGAAFHLRGLRPWMGDGRPGARIGSILRVCLAAGEP